MKKETFWKRGALVLAAALFTLAVFTACPTGDEDPVIEDKKPVISEPGLYKGYDMVAIDLSAVEMDTTVEEWKVESPGTKTYKKPKDLSADNGPSVLDKALKWLSTNAEDWDTYTIVIGEDLTYTPVIDMELWEDCSMWSDIKYLLGGIQINSNTLNGKQNITLVIKSLPGTTKTIRLNSTVTQEPAYLLKVGTFNNTRERSIRVILENIELRGLSGNATSKAPMNFVLGRGATLVVGDGATVGYHHNKRDEKTVEWGGDGNAGPNDSHAWGGGFAVLSGNLILDGGTIRNCFAETTVAGKGAYGAVAFMNNANGTSLFRIKRGLITGNQVISEGTARGGVATFYNWGDPDKGERCMFLMEGGEISGNTITGKGTVRGSVIGDAYYGNVNSSVEVIKITGGLIKDNKAEEGSGGVTGGVYTGIYLIDKLPVILGSAPDIQDPFVFYRDNTITVLNGFAPKTPIKVDFYGIPSLPDPDDSTKTISFYEVYAKDEIPSEIQTEYTGKQIAKWASGGTGDLSTKFVLNNWLYRKSASTAGDFRTKPITEIEIGADGKTVATTE